MIEKLDLIKHTDNLYDKNGFITNVACGGVVIKKVNELIDTVNTIQKEREAERFEIQEWIGILEAVRKSVNVHEKQIDELQLAKDVMFNRIDILNNATCDIRNAIENVQLDYVTTTYVTDGHTKEYYGQNGASIVIDHPLPAGYAITIREPETKGDNNDSPAN